jgi:hypothetical protein
MTETTVEIRGTKSSDSVYLRRAGQWALAVWRDLAKQYRATSPTTPQWLRPREGWTTADGERLSKKLALSESDPIVSQLLPAVRDLATKLSTNPVADEYNAAVAIHAEQNQIDPDPKSAPLPTANDDACRHGIPFADTCAECDEDF